MTESVVVLGAGYAGASAIQHLESALGSRADLTWVSERPYHLILHEVHRCIRDPSIEDHVTIPVEEIKSSSTTFREGRVEAVDVDERTVELAADDAIEYDYLVVALGSRTAFFHIDGLAKHAHTLKSLEDALAIHDTIEDVAAGASAASPARVVIGGAGQTGVQIAGEVAAYREEASLPLEVILLEGRDSVLPNENSSFRTAVRERLDAHSVDVRTGHFVNDVDDYCLTLDDDTELAYDVLIWAGGITGQEAMRDIRTERDQQSNRIKTTTSFQTDDDRVFALGDAALVEQPGDDPAPPTAQSAWQAAEVVAENVARTIRGEPLEEWRYENKGTVVSIGDDAVATDVMYSPIGTFNGVAAELLKKSIAARWITDIGSVSRAVAAWSEM